ncbi:helix-turn-helix domain-containing protein, partial [Xenorhabdus bovienii]
MPLHSIDFKKYARALKEAGFTQRFIATSLNRNPSTISRELKRNQA